MDRATPGASRDRLRRILYLLAIALVAAFLWRLGSAPWRMAGQHWHVMLAISALSAAGLLVQAMAFRLVAAVASRPALPATLAIWSSSAALSVVAPLLAGIAARTALLVRQGMRLEDCAVASLRQVWLGLEYALLLGALALPFTGWELSQAVALPCTAGWLCMAGLRLYAARRQGPEPAGRLARALHALRTPVAASAHPWFILQIVAMSAVYLVGFNGLGAEIDMAQALALSSLTVLLSLIAFVPNGLGVTDAVWVVFARSAGVEIETAVAIAIVIRLGHLIAAAALGALLHRRLGKTG